MASASPPAAAAAAAAAARLGRAGRREELLVVVVGKRLEPPSSPPHRHTPPFSSLPLSLPARHAAAASSSSSPSSSYPLTASIGSPPPAPVLQWNLDGRHIFVLNAIACAAAISASWLFFSAIPTLLAFKRAAESLEKLMDVTREELPDTMAAIRLSGMEISDLTMELSDLGQEINQGVKSSTRAVRVAEDRLRRLTTMAPAASVQVQVPRRNEEGGPVLAKTARNLREGIVKGRAVLGVVFALTHFSRWALNLFAARGKKRLL